jgi:hypothetical protein
MKLLSGKKDAENFRFIIASIDPHSDCILEEASFNVGDLDTLAKLIGEDACDIDDCLEYQLDAQQLEQIIETFKVSFTSRTPLVRLRSWNPTDDLPYEVHTGRELLLMLQGRKPLAVFSGQNPPNQDCEEVPERFFDPHVTAGKFIKREVIEPDRCGAYGKRFVFYAVLTETWRIDAYILMLNIAAKTGWGEGFERMQGSLLGYEDWQNDIFIENIYKRHLTK